jgi:hypothetical protein
MTASIVGWSHTPFGKHDGADIESLTGEAGAMQLPSAGGAGVVNMGGAAVANYASILEAAE